MLAMHASAAVELDCMPTLSNERILTLNASTTASRFGMSATKPVLVGTVANEPSSYPRNSYNGPVTTEGS